MTVINFLKNDIKLDGQTLQGLVFSEGPRKKLNLFQLIGSKSLDPVEICDVLSKFCKELRKVIKIEEFSAEKVLSREVFGQYTLLQLLVHRFVEKDEPFSDTLDQVYNFLNSHFGINKETCNELLLVKGFDNLLVIQSMILHKNKREDMNDVKTNKPKNCVSLYMSCLKSKLNLNFPKIKENFIMNERTNLLRISMEHHTDPAKCLKKMLKSINSDFQLTPEDILEIFTAKSYSGKNLLQFLVSIQSDKRMVAQSLNDILDLLTSTYSLKWEYVYELIASIGYKNMNLLHFIVFDCRYYWKIEKIVEKLLRFLISTFNTHITGVSLFLHIPSFSLNLI
jgi:hypothetical protein